MRAIILLLIIFATLPRVATAQLAITEFLASNSNGLQDELGNEEDWIEITNTSAGTVSLAGWYLTDSAANLRKWPLPAWPLAAGNRIVVFASDRNRTPPQTTPGQDNAGTPASPRLATNFKISTAAGGYLALSKDQAGGGVSVVSSFTNYPKQVTDVSYGLIANTTPLAGTASAVKALVPTTGNGGSGLGASWRGGAEPFNDAAWAAGTPGVGRAAAAAMVAAANLKLRLNANDAAALVTDTSGTGKAVTNTSGTTILMPSATDAQLSPVLRRGALQFDQASNSQVVIAAHGDMDASSGTIMFWMKAGPVIGGGNESSMLWDRRIGGQGIIIGLMNTTFAGGANAGKLFLQPNGGGSNLFSTIRVDDDQWHHIAFTYNQAAGGTDTFYIDGIVRGSVTHGSAWAWPPGQQTELGRSHDGYWHKYNGLMDEVRFYNTALSAAQIASIFNGADEDVSFTDIGLSVSATLPGNAGAFIRIPFHVANPATFTSLRLTSRVNDGFVAYLNGVQIDSLNAPASPAYNSLATTTALATRAKITDFTPPNLTAGTNMLAIHAMNNSTGDANFLAHHTLDGVSLDPAGNYLVSATPGAANSAIRTDIGPFITNVTGSPGNLASRPPGGVGSPPITVSATVSPSLRPLAAANPVQLAYRIMYNAETIVNMTPSGGGVYTANIPTTGLAAGRMLRWRVIASDNAAVQSTAPEFLRPTDSDQYYGTVALDGVTTQLTLYHVFVPGTYTFDNAHVIDQNNVGGRASFFYDGELYDNVFIRIKGDTTRTLFKRAHRVDFNSDHQLRWAPGQKRLRELNLNAEYVDPSYSRQFLSMWFHRLTGTGAPNHFPVRCHINGQFWQLAFHTETQDFELLDNIGLDPNGAFYCSIGQMAGVAGEKQTRTSEGTSDMANFVTAITNANLTTRENNVFDQVDLPAVINYIAAARMMQEGDDVWANMCIHRDSDGTGEWRIVPFDLNLSWGQLYYGDYTATHHTLLATDDTDKSHPLYGNSQCWTLNYAGVRYNRFYDAIISVPRTRQMLLRRIRTLMDSYLQPPGTVNGFFEQQLDAHIARIAPEVALDKAIWGWPSVGGPYGLGNDDLATAVNEIKTLFIAPRRTHYFTTHTSTTNVGIANANSAGIPASPQPASFPITIAGYDYNPADAGKQNAEWIQLTNPNAFAADISDWSLAGAVKFTFNGGTVVPAGGSIYISPRQQSFRARTTSPRGGEGRFVVGPYSGQISARGETIELRNAAGALVTSAVTPVNPTAAQQQIRITELNFNPPAPTGAESVALPGVGASDFEWIEILNTGPALNIGGATFTKGITFTFPAGYVIGAGARVVLVANQPAFTHRHGAGATIAGTFAGNLDNSGEQIELVDPNGEVILDFRYEDSWFPPADGGGYTLVVRNASPNHATYDNATHWAISSSAGGSPGAGDTAFSSHYDGWRWDHFSESEIYLPSPPNPSRTPNTALVGLLADADADGLNNFGEYAWCRNPRAGDHSALATVSIVNDGGTNYPAITFTRRQNALDVFYVVEATSDLAVADWQPVTLQFGAPMPLGDGAESVTHRDTVPHGPGARFLRVRAIKP